jgi:hypothetical protein
MGKTGKNICALLLYLTWLIDSVVYLAVLSVSYTVALMVDKWEHWWENQSTWKKTCCCANLASTNPL